MIYIYILLAVCYLLFNVIIALAMKGVYMGKRSLYWILFVLFGMPLVVILAVILIPYEVIKDWREHDKQ